MAEPDVVHYSLPERFQEAESEIDDFRPFMHGLKFLTPVLRDWICAKCNVLLLRAWKASCGHHFCGDCLVSSAHSPCPLDNFKNERDTQVERSAAVETGISRTFVICPFGCTYAYPAYDLAKHRWNCKAFASRFLKRDSSRHGARGAESGSNQDLAKYLNVDDESKKIVENSPGSDSSVVTHDHNEPIEDKECLKDKNDLGNQIVQLKLEVEILRRTLADEKELARKADCGYLETIRLLQDKVATLEGRCLSTTDVNIEVLEGATGDTAELKLTDNIVREFAWNILDLQKTLLSTGTLDGMLIKRSEEIYVDAGGLKMEIELHIKCLGVSESNPVSSWRLSSSMLAVKAVDSPFVELSRWPIKKYIQIEIIDPIVKRPRCVQETHWFNRPPSPKFELKCESVFDKKVFVEQILAHDRMTLKVTILDEREKNRKRSSWTGGGGT